MANENLFLLYAFRMGFFITFLYDNIRAVRRVISHNLFWISVEDLGFWFYCAVQVFLLMYRESNGTLRWFAILGALLGMLLYKKLLSRRYVRCLSFLLEKLCLCLLKIGRILFAPIRVAGNSAKKESKRLGRKAWKWLRRMKKKLTHYIKMLKM